MSAFLLLPNKPIKTVKEKWLTDNWAKVTKGRAYTNQNDDAVAQFVFDLTDGGQFSLCKDRGIKALVNLCVKHGVSMLVSPTVQNLY